MIVLERNEAGQFIKGNGLQDLTGNKYGRLVAVKLSDKRSGRKTYWECVCSCGNKKVVRTDSLKSGLIRSCGCLKKEQDAVNLPNGQGRVTHGLSKERLYSTWQGMLSRCENPLDKRYGYYGGRGIRVCDEWQSVERFVLWAESNGYSDELTIERINVDGNYEPLNCMWATLKEQARNKRNTIFITHNNETRPLAEWAEIKEINYCLLKNRYQVLGMRDPDLFKKERPLTKTATFISFNGKTLPMIEWARKFGINPGTLSERYRRGMKPPELFYPGDLRRTKQTKTTPR